MLKEQEAELKDVKDKNHEMKVGLWELRNQMMELKNLLEEEEE